MIATGHGATHKSAASSGSHRADRHSGATRMRDSLYCLILRILRRGGPPETSRTSALSENVRMSSQLNSAGTAERPRSITN
ncbi:unnamed protein product [Lota lota]